MVTALNNYRDAITRARWRLGNLPRDTFIPMEIMGTDVARKNLKIDESTKERLHGLKEYGETYDDLLNRLMDEVEDAS